MKAFIINLKKDKDRKAFMEKQLNDLQVEYQFIEGYAGKEKSNEEVYKIYDSKKSIKINGQDLNRSEIGCAYSHMLAYEQMKDQNISLAMILEDDVKIDNRLLKVINLIENKYKENNKLDFDWLQIDYVPPGLFFWYHWCSLSIKNIKNNFGKVKNLKTFIKLLITIVYILIKFIYISLLSIYEGLRNYFYKNISKIIKDYKDVDIVNFYRPLYLASAYIITREAVEKLLKINTPVIVTADRLPNYARINNNKSHNGQSKTFIMKAVAPLITEQQRKVFESNIVENNLK